MIGFGFAPNWWSLAILRLPLGAFEGLMFPGASRSSPFFLLCPLCLPRAGADLCPNKQRSSTSSRPGIRGTRRSAACRLFT
jgi:hypothetical protein